MDDYNQGVYEYLFTSNELLKRGDPSDLEAEILSRKIEDLSALLGEEQGFPGD